MMRKSRQLFLVLSFLLFSAIVLSDWYQKTDVDLLTNQKKVYLYTPAVSTDYSASKTPTLVIFFDYDKNIEIYINWNVTIGTNTHLVRYRFQNSEIITDEWLPSVSGQSTFCPDSLGTGETKMDFLKKLLASTEFVIRVENEYGNKYTAKFDVSGLSKQIAQYVHEVTQLWTYNTKSPIISSPAIDIDGNVFFGNNDGFIFALNSNGELLWKFKTNGRIISSPAVVSSKNTVFVGSYDGYLYCLSRLDGKLLWKFKTDGPIVSDPAVTDDGNTVIFGSNDSYVYAVNISGKLLWKFKTSSEVRSGPVISPDKTIYIGSFDGYLYALSLNGQLKWKFQSSSRISSTPAVDANGNIYFASYDGNVYALTPNKKVIWNIKVMGNIISSPIIGPDSTVYIGALDGNFYAIDSFGMTKWTFTANGGIYGTPLIDDKGNIYVPSKDGNIYAIDENGSLLWKFSTNSEIYSSLNLLNNKLIFGSSDNNLYCLYIPSSQLNPKSPWPKFRQNPRNLGRKIG